MKRLLLLVVSCLVVIALMFPAMGMAQGNDIFKAKCAACHGPDGKGGTSMAKAMGIKDLGGADIQKMSDAELNAAITNGKGKMPAYKGKLSDAQISELVSYIRTLKH